MTADVKQLLETMPEAPEAWADAQIGRYVFRRLVGTGGMGIVVAAHDPELDREVAIKIVVTGDTADNRPVREAQAMARLSHPNVVQVYEVIRLGLRTAIVMQLVEGEELATWQTASRSWREIVDAYVQASRGLAAAHRAGIVHRDFKPSNVLIDRDGVVRVTDFGLAQPERAGTDPGSTPVGTPAYMAPEQHRNATVDARTDQWGLACSLYEALYGHRPFASAEGSRLAEAVIRGELDPEPGDSPVPRRIRIAIRRALSVDPDLRFPTVDDFAAVLSARSRPWYVAAGAVAIIAIAVIVLMPSGSTGPAPCEGLDAPIRAVWSDPVRTELRARLLAPTTGLPETTVDKTLAGLDAYASEWATARTQACMESQQGVRSAETLDLRMRCLDRRLAEVSGLLDGVRGVASNDSALRATGDAVNALEPAASCYEAKDVSRPAAPDVRAAIDGAEQQLSRANALYQLGQYERALPLIDSAIAVGERVKAPDLTARALMWRGHCQGRLAKHKDALALYQRAAKLAAQAQDHVVLAEVLSNIFKTTGDHLGRPGDALASRPFVELAIEAAGQPDAVRSQFLHFLAAILYFDASKVEEALKLEKESLAIRQRIYPAGSVYIFDSMETLANAEAAHGNLDESERLLKQVLEGRIAARGPRDTSVGEAYNNLGVVQYRRSNVPAAIEYMSRAVEIANAAGRPNMAAEYNLAFSQLQIGRWNQAVKTFELTLGNSERLVGPESLDAGEASAYLGIALMATGDYEHGRPRLLHGIEVMRKVGSPFLPSALSHAARLALHDGDRAKAHALIDEALKLPTTDASLRLLVVGEIKLADAGCAAARPTLDQVLQADGEEMWVKTVARVELAKCEIAAGDLAAAKRRLDAELARLTKAKADEPALAPVRALLAKLPR